MNICSISGLNIQDLPLCCLQKQKSQFLGIATSAIYPYLCNALKNNDLQHYSYTFIV